VAIGRLADCDLVLEGDEVSRRHARIVDTPEGPLLVDRSRFGTLLNGEQVVGPTLVSLGDVLRIGRHELQVEAWTGPELADRLPTPRQRLRAWQARFGAPELAALIAGPVMAMIVLHRTGSSPVAAGAGAFAEALGFYGVLGWSERQQAAGKGVAAPDRSILRDLTREFGAAEAADTLLLRPLAYLGGLRLVGGWPGLLAGKFVADFLFHGPVLGLLHWRLAPRRTGLPTPRAARSTTAVRLPLITKE
jgi:pSer/pThr/pTyr-binding forkhead associated (FHA) protein